MCCLKVLFSGLGVATGGRAEEVALCWGAEVESLVGVLGDVEISLDFKDGVF